ncbi:MAG: hypothetical protein E6J82_12785 [Deltaproteobacteria bacterium]|nr:MAG: hypothetical protein E6J82_12785 [Deltaproteobacteria bacterium]
MPARSPTRRSDTRARRRGRQATTGWRRRQVPRRSRSGDEEPRAIGVWSRCRVRERVRLAPARGRDRAGREVRQGPQRGCLRAARDRHRRSEPPLRSTGARSGPAARDALARSRDCGNTKVAVQKPADRQPATLSVSAKDTDGDGVPDVDDLCPDVPGPAEHRGCPVFTDRDGDGVADDIDRCPELAGPKENFGCPWPDRDGDRVADKDDRCPDEPGTPENQGCPRRTALIVIRRDRIELKQQIHFQPNRAKILSDSFDVLREVAQAIKDAPVAVRIEGHTDNVGKRKENTWFRRASNPNSSSPSDSGRSDPSRPTRPKPAAP